MGTIFSIIRSPKVLFIITIILAIIVILSLLLIGNNKKKEGPPVQIREIPASQVPLVTPTEIEIKNILFVTSDPAGARVLIDVPEQDVWIPDNNAPSTTPATVMTTPFRITNVAQGKHILSIFKDGYLQETKTIEIGSEKEIQINIILKAAQ